ncbi:MAG: hypothetical protein WCA36_08820 [Pseudolabrys sp.]|jgi:hypothetical protein
MLQNLSDQIRQCHARATEARARAAETADPALRAEFEQMEQGWLRLAESYALSERLQHYLLEQDTKIARRGEWQSVATAPFDRNIELAVIRSSVPHAVAFPCRRILGGWMDAEAKERIDVRPTHWRDWL